MPVGNAGNISSHWLGYSEYLDDGVIHEPPQLFGFQAAGAAPIVLGAPVKDPQTIATAIRIGNPASWDLAVSAATESEGAIAAVTDRQILAAYRRVAREGLFAEPASAASVAGLLQLHDGGKLPAGATVVCILTGHGLKDPEWAISGAARPGRPCRPIAAVVAAELGLWVRVTVRVPATSANLGPGFDCFGLALDLCNEVTVDTEAEPGVSWEGEGADELPTDGSDMVSRGDRDHRGAAGRHAARAPRSPASPCTA